MHRPSAFVFILFLLVFIPGSLSAQDHDMAGMTMSSSGWVWTYDANAFIGRNIQLRHFADYKVWESQNWLMVDTARGSGAHRFDAEMMLSLEPFTMHPQGSPQLFQTGESYQNVPLYNLQHPHDLFMGLGATYHYTHERLTYTIGADLVGEPTLGPPVFMHRASARDNPQVPLIHHYLDSTHSTPGVVRGGVGVGPWVFEASVFRGAEPDENRTNIEAPALDSWAARVRWHQGPWALQFSGGHLKQPEWWEPFDMTRLTASLMFDGRFMSRPLAVTLAWGENRQFNGINGNVDGFLLEGDYGLSTRSTLYGRFEAAGKEILGIGYHPRGEFVHPHWITDIRVPTIGYLYDVALTRAGRFGLGADVTFYNLAPDMQVYYEGSSSYHFFLRWRPNTAPMHHMH